MNDYAQLPDPPRSASAVSVLIRTFDSMGFRFRYATDGLAEADLAYSPAEGAMTLGRQIAHVRRLLQWADIALQSKSEAVEELEDDLQTMRNDVFAALDALKATVRDLGEEGLESVEVFKLPFWNLINGPITDVFAHIGQINTYRRMLGKPSPGINYFSGKVSMRLRDSSDE